MPAFLRTRAAALFSAALFVTVASTADAQGIASPALDPVLGPVLGGLECPSDPVRIAVIGDSLADGLWGSFYRAFAACASVEVLRRSTVSDGLAGSDADDWLGRLAFDGALDLIVVQVGANDIRNIREGTQRHAWGGDTWDAAYGARVTALADGLAGRAREVIWMGLPIVGEARFEDGYRTISGVQADAASAAGVRFVDTHTPTTFGQGAFVMSADIDGSLRQIRNTDQVHFTQIGYDMVAGLLRADVEKIFATSGRAVAIDALALQ